MGIQESIDLFNSKIDKTYWTRQNILPSGKIGRTVDNPVVLPINNYYKMLQKKYVQVDHASGSVPAFHTSNFAEYYANTRTNEAIAVVKSVKTVESIPTKISIATYYDVGGDIAILNRFDQTGRPHDNYFDVYGNSLSDEEFSFYKKYLSDREFNDPASGMHYQVFVPHIHFNTRNQTLAFGHHDKANAISIEKLIVYLNDLKNDFNPNSLLNKNDMGMPFLDLKKAKLEYTSTMLSSIREILNYFDEMRRVDPSKFSDYEKDTFDLIKSLINIDKGEMGENSTITSPDGSSSPDGNSSDGLNMSLISSSGPSGGLSLGTSYLAESDLVYIVNNMPDLDKMDLVSLNDVKKYISKLIRDLENDRKRSSENLNERRNNKESNEQILRYKDYLKYVKGLLNLKTILVDLDKYMKIYEVLNERDPMLMSLISKELLENLTINIKSSTEMDRGGVEYDRNSRQPL